MLITVIIKIFATVIVNFTIPTTTQHPVFFCQLFAICIYTINLITIASRRVDKIEFQM